MEKLVYYKKRRKDFGRACHFQKHEQILFDIKPNKDLLEKYYIKKIVNKKITAGPSYSAIEANTKHIDLKSTLVHHVEGGWPVDVDWFNDIETFQHLKRVEKTEGYVRSIKKHTKCLKEFMNPIIIKSFDHKLQDLGSEPLLPEFHCNIIARFSDPKKISRPVKHLTWLNTGDTSHLIGTYGNAEYNRSSNGSKESYIWNIEYMYKPWMKLTTPSQALCIESNPKNVNLLVGSLVNGCVTIWDIRRGSVPVQTSLPDHSHKEIAKHVLWIQSKSGTEFFSGGTEGSIRWWDSRHLLEPTDIVITDLKEDPWYSRASGVNVLEYEPSQPLKFMIGTDSGYVWTGDRRGKTNFEKISGFSHRIYLGPVNSISRNIINPKIFLTVGDYSTKIFSEEEAAPIIDLSSPEGGLTNGVWSTTKYSSLFTTRSDGCLDAWNILVDMKSPILSTKICSEPLTSILCQDNGEFVVVGTENGDIYMIQYSDTFVLNLDDEKDLLGELIERELRREKNYQSKVKEMEYFKKLDKPIQEPETIKSIFNSSEVKDANKLFKKFKKELQKHLLVLEGIQLKKKKKRKDDEEEEEEEEEESGENEENEYSEEERQDET